MPLKITAFTHPEYDVLRQRSETLATWWEVAHVIFVLFLIMAVTMPLALFLAVLISPDAPKERILSVGLGSSGGSLFISALSFFIRRYVAKKGRRFDASQPKG